MDMCTGSGCIIISIMRNCSDLIGFGYDISKQALIVAKDNARLNNVSVVFERSDLFENVTGKFDVIVSNPPYIRTEEIEGLMPEVAVFEPIEALDGKEDGLYFYREIISRSKDYLNENGRLIFEVGYDQGPDVLCLMRNKGFKDIRIVKDLAGNDRVVIGGI